MDFYSKTSILALEVRKDDLIQHPALADPNDPNSMKIKKNVCSIHRTESPRVFITYKCTANKIFNATGNTNNGKTQVLLVQRLMDGVACSQHRAKNSIL